MKRRTIALTGTEPAREACALQLQALINGRALNLDVLDHLTDSAQARAIYAEGGEVWHCGTRWPCDRLQAHIDRTLPADDFAAMGVQVVAALAQFLGKTPITGEAAHG